MNSSYIFNMEVITRATCCFLLFVTTLADAAAQQPILYFQRLDETNGLSHNNVNCILQDKRGFTWIGTNDGLNRYDGNNFVVFKNVPGNSSSLSGNTIKDLHEDKDGILWIATADGGISKYDHRLKPTEQFTQFKHHPGVAKSIPVNIVNALQEDAAGNLWLATSGAGVLKFDKKTNSFHQPPGTGPWTIYDICTDSKGILWAGREGGSILKVDPNTMRLHVDSQYRNLYAPLPHVVVTSLFKDSKNDIWFGSWDKVVYRYLSATDSEQSFSTRKNSNFSFGNDEATAFNEDGTGRIWIGAKNAGLYIFERTSGHFYNYKHDPATEGSISSNSVNCIFKDKAGAMWIGTNKGISIYRGTQQPFVQAFLPAATNGKVEPLIIYDFLERDDGSVWIGTNRGLYIKQANGSYQVKKLVYKGEQLAVTKFYEDGFGRTYFGTNYSLFVYNELKNSLAALPNTEKDLVMAKLIESRIVSITEDSIDGKPVLITVPYGHFFTYYDFASGRWISRKDSAANLLGRYNISDNLIRKIVKTRDGSLWFANAKHGLMHLDIKKRVNKKFINDPAVSSSLSNNNVYDIKETTNGNLWVSTYGGGLNYLDTTSKRFRHFVSDNNLLEGLAIDSKENVWAIGNGNLQRFDPRTNTFAYARLPDLEKTGGVSGYIYKNRKGKMYVAGRGYFIAFDPLAIKFEQKQPEVFFTDFSIFNQSYTHLLQQKEIALRHNQNFFTIHFSAPFYDATVPVQYSYILEGIDEHWINAGVSTQAHYTNLGGGSYIFKVRATATPGIWSEKIATIQIRIIPPVWKRWWFIVLSFFSMVGIGYLLYRYRINEILQRQAIRNKIAQDLHDSVGSTLSSISVYSQVAKIYNEQHKPTDLKHTLEKIGIASSEMISELSDTVWAINPRNDNMQTILQRMESFARPLLLSQEILFHFEVEPAVSHLALEMTKRKNFYLIFKEAVNNVLKYSASKNLWVRITYQHSHLLVSIIDDGKGFDQELTDSTSSLSGNGLPNMQRRAREMKGTCEITSVVGKGTTIWLRFPIP